MFVRPENPQTVAASPCRILFLFKSTHPLIEMLRHNGWTEEKNKWRIQRSLKSTTNLSVS
jgi:hypothetical protein